VTGAAKAEARKAAFARRQAAHAAVDAAPAQAHLWRVLQQFGGRVVSGYLPIRTEIDPRPVMALAAAQGPVCVPVIDGPGLPLRFRAWRPATVLVPGPFGAEVPNAGAWLVPEVLIVPLVAFDPDGGRLGYGGGFYDRTLARLRRDGDPVAIGFAFAGQQDEDLPCEATDQRLDAVVTEVGVIGRPGGRLR
jgi:5-formyltetrahydrofolate cyclo-ligase